MGPEQSHVTGKPRFGHSATEELREDIAHTRREMDETIDELGERLRPRHILDEVLDWWHSSRSAGKEAAASSLSDSLQAIGNATAHQIRQHPVPSLLVGAAVAWLVFGEEDEEDRDKRRSRRYLRHTELDPDVEAGIYSGSIVDARTGEPYDDEAYEDLEAMDSGDAYGEASEGESRMGAAAAHAAEGARTASAKTKEWGRQAAHGAGSATHRAGEMAGAAREGISSAAEGVSRTARRMASGSRRAAERTGHWAGGVRERAGHWAGDVRERAGRSSHAVSRGAQQGYATAVERFTEASEDYPLAVGAGFFAAGLLSGLLLPSTRREDRVLGPMADEVKHRAKEVGEELMERGQEIAGATMAAAKEEAEAQGLMPDQIAARAKHLAERVEDAALEEGLSTSTFGEKAGEVVRHAKDTAVHEGQKHRNEVSAEAKEETKKAKESLGVGQGHPMGGTSEATDVCEVRPEDFGGNPT